MRVVALSLLCAASLLACTDGPASPVLQSRELPLPEGEVRDRNFVRQVGLAWVEADTPHVTVPTRIRRGTPLTVRVAVTTGGCTGSDTTVTTVSGRSATIVPYTSAPLPSALPVINCIALAIRDERQPTVVFTQTGEALVRVVLRGGPANALQVFERRVTVTE